MNHQEELNLQNLPWLSGLLNEEKMNLLEFDGITAILGGMPKTAQPKAIIMYTTQFKHDIRAAGLKVKSIFPETKFAGITKPESMKTTLKIMLKMLVIEPH